MLTINLISGKLKNEIKLRRIYAIVLTVFYVTIVMLILSVTALTVSRMMLKNTFNHIETESNQVNKNSQNYNNKVSDINARVKEIGKIQDDYVPWSYLIENIGNIVPAGISLDSIGLDYPSKSIKIAGHAQTRDGLLIFNKALENDKFLTAIDFPLRNILEKESIDFNISAKINIDNLRINFKSDAEKPIE